MYINKIGGEIKFTAEKVLSQDSPYLLLDSLDIRIGRVMGLQ
jgi:hypothetical protein